MAKGQIQIFQDTSVFTWVSLPGKRRALYYSRKSPQKAKTNHDAMAYRIDGDNFILALSDGMGGMAFSQEASHFLLENSLAGIDRYSSFEESIFRTGRALEKKYKGSGATLASLSVKEDLILAWTVGDSPIFAYNVNSKEKLFRTRIDNSYGMLKEALGDPLTKFFTEKELNYKKCELVNSVSFGRFSIHSYFPGFDLKNHAYCLCSDGFHDLIEENYPEEIFNLLNKGPLEFQEAFEAFVDEGIRKIKAPHDDLSMILLLPDQWQDS